MKRRAVAYLPAAQRDLIEAFEYVRKDNPLAAAGWLQRVDKALGRLASFPRLGLVPRDSRLASRGYRMVVLGENLAFYVVLAQTVEVRRIVHGRRRYDFLFRKSASPRS